MRVLLALGEVLVSARLPRQSGLSFEFCMPGGDASTVQWLRSWSSDFIETRWASWSPSRQLRERSGEHRGRKWKPKN